MMGVDLIDGKPAGHGLSQARSLFGHSQQGALRQGTEIRQMNVLGHETTTNVTKSNWRFKLRHEDKVVKTSLEGLSRVGDCTGKQGNAVLTWQSRTWGTRC